MGTGCTLRYRGLICREQTAMNQGIVGCTPTNVPPTGNPDISYNHQESLEGTVHAILPSMKSPEIVSGRHLRWIIEIAKS